MNLKTIREAAWALDMGEAKLRRAALSGKVPVLRVGNRLLVDVDGARELVKRDRAAVGVKKVSEKTGLSVSAIYRAVREGWLPAEKNGKSYEFDMEAVMAAIEKKIREG